MICNKCKRKETCIVRQGVSDRCLFYLEDEKYAKHDLPDIFKGIFGIKK